MSVYEGSEPYIFVSYAHKDSGVVLPIIQMLDQAGFRVWFDSGIEAGTEWPAYIEDHLQRSGCVLVFMSPSAVASVNCRNEINYACLLNKDMLVIYLEETQLAQGMNLQLNAIQSMFRYRHRSDESFARELCRAKLLEPCKGEGHVPQTPPRAEEEPTIGTEWMKTGDRQALKANRARGNAVIAKINTIGSSDATNHWPLGTYSPVIDIDQHSVVHFQATFLRGVENAGQKEIGLLIYDKDDALIYERVVKISFAKGNDRMSMAWVVRDEMGMTQHPGVYTAVLFVEDSRAVEYRFRLKSAQYDQLHLETEEEVRQEKQEAAELNTPEEAELIKKLNYPRMFWHSIVYYWAFLIGVGALASESYVIGVVLLIVSLIFSIRLLKQTLTHVIRYKLVAILLVYVAGTYYGIYLFVMAIITWCNRKKWKAELEQLQKG